jgi:hypothetical protein
MLTWSVCTTAREDGADPPPAGIDMALDEPPQADINRTTAAAPPMNVTMVRFRAMSVFPGIVDLPFGSRSSPRDRGSGYTERFRDPREIVAV